ncbi:MAG TPA: hypothetical protein VE641_15220, partial [Chthoniobacterales bacterium]|nr:hypothetical protein [Chthoniobacterales bacterium]
RKRAPGLATDGINGHIRLSGFGSRIAIYGLDRLPHTFTPIRRHAATPIRRHAHLSLVVYP